MRALFLVLLLAPGLAAQEPRILSLGLGRSRLELVLEQRLALRPDDSARVEVGRLPFRERWLQRELPRIVAGLESVDVVERIQARKNLTGLTATRDRLLEITGPDDAVRAAGRFLERIARSVDRRIQARVWLVQLRSPAVSGAAPSFESLGETALNRRLEELASSEDAQIIERTELDFLSGHESSIAVGNRIDYVGDLRVSSGAGRLFVEPITVSFQEGLRWSMGALLEPETGRLHVETEFVLARAARPLARLQGRIGREARSLVIEKPIVAETRWATDGLVLAPEHFGFRVTGLVPPRPGTDVTGPARQLEILCQIQSVVAAAPKEGGLVQGFDRDEGLAFALVEEGKRATGDIVLFERAGQKIGVGRIDEVLGSLVTVTVTEGRPQLGDRLR